VDDDSSNDDGTPVPETFNRFLVGVNGPSVVFLRPVPRRLSRPEAMNLAAYLVALGEETPGDFDRLLAAIRNT